MMCMLHSAGCQQWWLTSAVHRCALVKQDGGTRAFDMDNALIFTDICTAFAPWRDEGAWAAGALRVLQNVAPVLGSQFDPHQGEVGLKTCMRSSALPLQSMKSSHRAPALLLALRQDLVHCLGLHACSILPAARGRQPAS